GRRRESGPPRARVLLDRGRRAGARKRAGQRLRCGVRWAAHLGDAAAPGPDAARARRGAGEVGAARAFALLMLLAACAHHPARRTLAGAEIGVSHKVRAGETLWRIAHAYGVQLSVLLRENRLENPAQLETGTLLW